MQHCWRLCQLIQLLERHSILQETSQCFTAQCLPYDQRDRYIHVCPDQTRILWIMILLWSWLQPAQTNQHLAHGTSLTSGPWIPGSSVTLRINQIHGLTIAPLSYSTPVFALATGRDHGLPGLLFWYPVQNFFFFSGHKLDHLTMYHKSLDVSHAGVTRNIFINLCPTRTTQPSSFVFFSKPQSSSAKICLSFSLSLPQVIFYW